MTERDALFEAFCAGFSWSGEGSNEEYPYGDKGISIWDCPQIRGAFERWWTTEWPKVRAEPGTGRGSLQKQESQMTSGEDQESEGEKGG